MNSNDLSILLNELEEGFKQKGFLQLSQEIRTLHEAFKFESANSDSNINRLIKEFMTKALVSIYEQLFLPYDYLTQIDRFFEKNANLDLGKIEISYNNFSENENLQQYQDEMRKIQEVEPWFRKLVQQAKQEGLLINGSLLEEYIDDYKS